jgi:hypothetical protein
MNRSPIGFLVLGLSFFVAIGCDTTSSSSGSGSGGSSDGGTVNADAGGGGSDGGSVDAGGGGSPDGGTDGGMAADCEGLSPGALPARVSYQATYSSSSSPNFCQLPIGEGAGFVALQTRDGFHPSWTILSPAGTKTGSFGVWQGQAWPDPSGFIGYGGSSTEQVVVVTAYDTTGRAVGSSQVHGDAIFASDPSGGLFAVGHIANAPAGTGQPPSSPVAIMFNADGSVRWGPTPLASGNAAVFGAGVDLLGRAVAIVDGGSGSIEAIWFDKNGAPATGVFQILSSFQPGPSTWFETSPLLGGGLALRRMDAPSSGPFEELRSSQWLLLLPSGVASTQPAPDWLTQRPDTNMQLARSGHAYAFSPWATQASTCDQQVEIVSPAGNSCGKADFPVDGNSCQTRELRLGLDGTVMQMLPASREQNQPPGSPVFTCTLRYWPAALK